MLPRSAADAIASICVTHGAAHPLISGFPGTYDAANDEDPRCRNSQNPMHAATSNSMPVAILDLRDMIPRVKRKRAGDQWQNEADFRLDTV